MTAALDDADLTALLATFDAIGGHLRADLGMIDAKLPELRRLAKAEQRRRGGSGSGDARKYALGSVLVMLGLEQEDTALLGLFAHSDHMLRWMAEARHAFGPQTFSELIGHVLADPERLAYCQQWGRILQWRYCKPLYDASVTSFIQSGRTGPKERWRKHDVSDDQAALIRKLCEILGEPLPPLMTKGEAFDWIYERGGNPKYWAEPEMPSTWSW